MTREQVINDLTNGYQVSVTSFAQAIGLEVFDTAYPENWWAEYHNKPGFEAPACWLYAKDNKILGRPVFWGEMYRRLFFGGE